MLVIGQPDKMHREQRNRKQNIELFAKRMEILVGGENHNVLNPVFPLCMSECLAEV
jgi:RNase H-fold protein (predicted Holliday junction resolvase)